MVIKKVDILQPLFERLKKGSVKEYSSSLVFGVPAKAGGSPHPVAVTIIRYTGEDSLKLAAATLPFGLSLIGIVEFEQDEEQELYSRLDNVGDAILLKVCDGKMSATTGLDYLTPLHLNVVSPEQFWEKNVCTFRIQGKFLINSILEFPELNECFEEAKVRVFNQAAYAIGSNHSVTLLPRSGHVVSEINQIRSNAKVSEVVTGLKSDVVASRESSQVYFCPSMALIKVTMLQDHSKASPTKSAALIVTDKTAWCKLFEHYVDIDVLVVMPTCMSAALLYKHFNYAVCAQLQFGYHANIVQQLANSISAEKPQVFHLWPNFCQHFVTVLYPGNTSEEKLKEKRHELHQLYFAQETRPYFRRPAALFQPSVGLISPHVSLKGKFSETEVITGHYEYRHYMQDDFNDDGWGCAYRSLQTIISWFRLQGFTSRKVPSHREIQECLVSLGDKPQSFVGSRQWIGSTEVSFVLEALLGISCRIVSLSSGADMASRVSDLLSHFKIHGTPVMIGGGVLAHTLIGASWDANCEWDVNYLVLDPHYTSKDDLKTILSKGWVGWKDNNFWSKKDFYNMCMPLLPSAI